MGKLPFKRYKFSPFSSRFLFHVIRRRIWDLKEKHSEDRSLKKDMEEAIAEMRHLRMMINEGIRIDIADPKIKIKQLQKRIKNDYREICENMGKEVKDIGKIDLKGQPIIFRGLKEVKGFERAVKAKLAELRKNEMLTAKSREDIKTVKTRHMTAYTAVQNAIDMLDRKLSLTLKHIWQMANRQYMQGGIETVAVLDTEREEKLLRVEKVEGKQTLELMAEQKERIREMQRAKTLGEFIRSFRLLVHLYAKELNALQKMVAKHRIFVFDLRGNLSTMEKLAERGNLDKEGIEDLKKAIHEELSEIETLYSWLYHEIRRYQRIKLDKVEEGSYELPRKAA